MDICVEVKKLQGYEDGYDVWCQDQKSKNRHCPDKNTMCLYESRKLKVVRLCQQRKRIADWTSSLRWRVCHEFDFGECCRVFPLATDGGGIKTTPLIGGAVLVIKYDSPSRNLVVFC